MRAIADSPDGEEVEVDALAAGLTRLEHKVEEASRQLDRLEAEVAHTLGELAQERFGEYS